MPSSKIDRRETVEKRVMLYLLLFDGMEQTEALKAVLGKRDSNRPRTLERWKNRGLFPPSDAEITEAQAQVQPEIDKIMRDWNSKQKPSEGIGKMLPIKHVTRREFQEAIEEINYSIRQIEETMQTFLTAPKQSEIQDLPPRPILDGRHHTIKRVKLGVTLDPVLAGLLEGEAKRRNLTLSSLTDAILWNHFDRPKLSFEAPQPERPKGPTIIKVSGVNPKPPEFSADLLEKKRQQYVKDCGWGDDIQDEETPEL